MHLLAPAFRTCFRCAARPWVISPTVLARRPLTSSSQGLPGEMFTADLIEEPDVIGDFETESMGDEGSETPRSYRAFMDKIGFQYRFARPQQWLGRNAPFPMNPSFRPPPPISDHQREIMWQLFSRNSQTFSVRRLARRFNLSRKRVDAILRLKGMEKDWIKVAHYYHLVPTSIADILFHGTLVFYSSFLKQGKDLQTGFLQGMERLMNAQTHIAIPRMTELLDNPEEGTLIAPDVLLQRLDVHKADILEEVEQRDATPYRYERSYWESIPEDTDEPILPNILQHVKKGAEAKRILKEMKKKQAFTRSVPDTQFIRRPKHRVMTKNRKDRPPTKFVDVGAEFVDVKEVTKRISVAARKSSIREKKALNVVRRTHN